MNGHLGGYMKRKTVVEGDDDPSSQRVSGGEDKKRRLKAQWYDTTQRGIGSGGSRREDIQGRLRPVGDGIRGCGPVRARTDLREPSFTIGPLVA